MFVTSGVVCPILHNPDRRYFGKFLSPSRQGIFRKIFREIWIWSNGRPNTAVGCLVVTLVPVCQRPASDEKSRSFAVVGFLAGGGFGRPSWATTAHGPALCPRRVGLASLATPHAPLGAPGTRPPTCPIGPAKQAHFGVPLSARVIACAGKGARMRDAGAGQRVERV